MIGINRKNHSIAIEVALISMLCLFAFGLRSYASEYGYEEPARQNLSNEELRQRYLDNIREREEAYEDIQAWERERMRLYQERVEERQHRLDAMLERREELDRRAEERLERARTVSDLYTESERMRYINILFILLMVLVLLVALISVALHMRPSRKKRR